MYKIKIYVDKNGKSEIKEYFDKLKNSNGKDSRVKFNKIKLCIELLKEYGLSLGEPHIKKLTYEIWELRPLRDRILFASVQDEKIVFLSVFMKRTNKTPKREIEKAERILKDYKKRGEENG